MSYGVVYSAQARQDLRDLYEYIVYDLFEVSTAVGQIRRIMKAVCSLEEMPMRHRLYKEEPWQSQGMRYLPVDNYIVFFLPDESESIVHIIRIMYSGRDFSRHLNF